MPLYQVNLPANVEIYLSAFRKSTRFDNLGGTLLRDLLADPVILLPNNILSADLSDSFVANLGFYVILITLIVLVGLVLYPMTGSRAAAVKETMLSKLKYGLIYRLA